MPKIIKNTNPADCPENDRLLNTYRYGLKRCRLWEANACFCGVQPSAWVSSLFCGLPVPE